MVWLGKVARGLSGFVEISKRIGLDTPNWPRSPVLADLLAELGCPSPLLHDIVSRSAERIEHLDKAPM